MIILVAALNIVSAYHAGEDKGHDIAILRTMAATRGASRGLLHNRAAIGSPGRLAGYRWLAHRS